MSIFDGQYGGFGGGFIGGPTGGKSGVQGMQFGGGFMMNPMQGTPMIQEVQVGGGAGGVTYAIASDKFRSQDRRSFPQGGVQRRKRY